MQSVSRAKRSLEFYGADKYSPTGNRGRLGISIANLVRDGRITGRQQSRLILLEVSASSETPHLKLNHWGVLQMLMIRGIPVPSVLFRVDRFIWSLWQIGMLRIEQGIIQNDEPVEQWHIAIICLFDLLVEPHVVAEGTDFEQQKGGLLDTEKFPSVDWNWSVIDILKYLFDDAIVADLKTNQKQNTLPRGRGYIHHEMNILGSVTMRQMIQIEFQHGFNASFYIARTAYIMGLVSLSKNNNGFEALELDKAHLILDKPDQGLLNGRADEKHIRPLVARFSELSASHVQHALTQYTIYEGPTILGLYDDVRQIRKQGVKTLPFGSIIPEYQLPFQNEPAIDLLWSEKKPEDESVGNSSEIQENQVLDDQHKPNVDQQGDVLLDTGRRSDFSRSNDRDHDSFAAARRRLTKPGSRHIQSTVQTRQQRLANSLQRVVSGSGMSLRPRSGREQPSIYHSFERSNDSDRIKPRVLSRGRSRELDQSVEQPSQSFKSISLPDSQLRRDFYGIVAPPRSQHTIDDQSNISVLAQSQVVDVQQFHELGFPRDVLQFPEPTMPPGAQVHQERIVVGDIPPQENIENPLQMPVQEIVPEQPIVVAQVQPFQEQMPVEQDIRPLAQPVLVQRRIDEFQPRNQQRFPPEQEVINWADQRLQDGQQRRGHNFIIMNQGNMQAEVLNERQVGVVLDGGGVAVRNRKNNQDYIWNDVLDQAAARQRFGPYAESLYLPRVDQNQYQPDRELLNHSVDGRLGKRAYEQMAHTYSVADPDRVAFMRRNVGQNVIGEYRDGIYFPPDSEQQYYQNGDPSGVYYDGYGLMPQKLFQKVRNMDMFDKHPVKRQALKQVWGGTLAPMPTKVTTSVKNTMDDQYANVVEAIEQTLGTRLKTGLWQGRIATQKAIWDMWIEYVKVQWIQQLQSRAIVIQRFQEDAIAYDQSSIAAMDTVVDLGKNLIDMSLFLNNNLNLNDTNRKIYLAVELVNTAALSSDQYRDETIEAIKQWSPEYADKLFWVKGPSGYRLYLRIRAFTKNTSEFKWRLSPKYGPFDILYKKMDSFKKTYIDPGDFNPNGIGDDPDGVLQADIIQENIAASLEKQLADFNRSIGSDMFMTQAGSIQFGNFVLASSQEIIEILIAPKSLTIKRLENINDYFLYLRANHTLAKWFSGKKSALQKINQERITSYLDRDKQNLKNVMHFFGGDAKFVDKKR